MNIIIEPDFLFKIRVGWEKLQIALTEMHNNYIHPLSDDPSYWNNFKSLGETLKFLNAETNVDIDMCGFVEQTWIPFLEMLRKPSTYFDMSDVVKYFEERNKYVKMMSETLFPQQIIEDFNSFTFSIKHFEILMLKSDADIQIPSISYFAASIGSMAIIVRKFQQKLNEIVKYYGMNPFEDIANQYNKARQVVSDFGKYQQTLFFAEQLNSLFSHFKIKKYMDEHKSIETDIKKLQVVNNCLLKRSRDFIEQIKENDKKQKSSQKYRDVRKKFEMDYLSIDTIEISDIEKNLIKKPQNLQNAKLKWDETYKMIARDNKASIN